MSFETAGLDLYLLGETADDLAGSEWAYLHGQRGGNSPIADLQREMRLIDLLVAGRVEKIFTAAHDLSQGGLSATLTEMVLRHNVGASVAVENIGMALISETPGRVVVAIDPSKTKALTDLASAHQIVLTKLGSTGGDALVINGASIPLTKLRSAWTETFPKLFG
jgi:phosphoribosylformylglycinamidine synthase